MVPDAGTPVRADSLRPLNRPRPLTVTARGSLPCTLLLRGHQLPVGEISDIWRIDDEWWRVRISRCYYQLILTDGAICTIYHDLATGAWYAQAY